ncbi:MAG: Shikimate kinase [Candidatus Tokpelaia hoelldobleri]|uniref:Shikimate kinase n=1 Tax=Candidatus Tokpelaia hoelldobleri TaxID=1902579 RepID=A0A1U9JS75_9HYPH|nr:MAG: Shikimate kinase [Candidatus Tokpelaia hoelldoblerii]
MIHKHKNKPLSRKAQRVRFELGQRSLVLVGLMGAGKSTIGKRLAAMLDLRFCDADHEIEAASQMTITELFASYGEEEFRALERRVISRLLKDGPVVLATGGGAFINKEIRDVIKAKGISIWLNADIDVLMERVSRKNTRPLLQTENPRAVMQKLMDERYPVYATADLAVESRNTQRDRIARNVIKAVSLYLQNLTGKLSDEN